LKSVRDQSRLLVGLIVLFIVGYAGLSFWLFYKGLNFVEGHFPGLGIVLTERLLYLLFAFLFVLLLLSNLVISYTNLFRNRETSFLLTMPVTTHTIFRWKFLESALLASWAFVFLIAPLLAAYGLTRGVPWHFYVITVLLVALFIVLPAVIGSFVAVSVARYLDRRFQVLAMGSLLILLIAAAIWLETGLEFPGIHRNPCPGCPRQDALSNSFRGIPAAAQLLAVPQRAAMGRMARWWPRCFSCWSCLAMSRSLACFHSHTWATCFMTRRPRCKAVAAFSASGPGSARQRKAEEGTCAPGRVERVATHCAGWDRTCAHCW
jgi:hypothetical protein